MRITFGVIGFLLNTVATILKFTFMPILVLYGYIKILLIRDKVKRDTEFGYYNKDIALVKDVLGNVAGKYLFNDLFIVRKYFDKAHWFGKKDETISYVLGRNMILGTISRAGVLLCKVLSLFDKDHCIKSATDNRRDNIIISTHNNRKDKKSL